MSFAQEIPPEDGAELSIIYRRHARWLFGRLRQLDGNLAEDVVQEVFLRASKYHAAHPIHHPRAFLLKIARNVLLSDARRAKASARSQHVSLDDAPKLSSASDQFESVVLKETILALPEIYRDVFLLSRFGGMSYAQIAEARGIFRQDRGMADVAGVGDVRRQDAFIADAMNPELQNPSRAHQEAAQWFTRLNDTTVSTQDLSAFRVWRREPANDAAYGAVESTWRVSASLGQDPQIADALKAAEARNTPRLQRGSRWTWLAPVGAAAVAGLAGVVVFQLSGFNGRVYQTVVGEQGTITLDDGTRVKLDTDSRIAVRYTAKARTIQLLRGQAMFDVTHRADRPMIVAIGDTVVRDLGTRFDVRRDSSSVRVTVLEGSVQVTTSSRAVPWTLTRNQQLSTGAERAAPVEVDAAKATSWTSGRLVFEDLPLRRAVVEMNRYSTHKLILDAGGVGDTKVNGAFDSTDTAAFVSAVARLYDLKADSQADGSIRLANATLDRDGE